MSKRTARNHPAQLENRVMSYRRYSIPIIVVLLVCVGWSLWAAEPGGTPKPAPSGQPTTTTLPDGTPVTTNPDGSQTSQYEPGSSYTRNADGSRTIEESSRGPDGQPVKTKTTYK